MIVARSGTLAWLSSQVLAISNCGFSSLPLKSANFRVFVRPKRQEVKINLKHVTVFEEAQSLADERTKMTSHIGIIDGQQNPKSKNQKFHHEAIDHPSQHYGSQASGKREHHQHYHQGTSSQRKRSGSRSFKSRSTPSKAFDSTSAARQVSIVPMPSNRQIQCNHGSKQVMISTLPRKFAISISISTEPARIDFCFDMSWGGNGFSAPHTKMLRRRASRPSPE